MRSMLTAAVMLGLAAAPAFAQSNVLTNPAAPSSSQAAPQSANSLPPGAGAQSQPTSNGRAVNNMGTSNTLTQPPAGGGTVKPAVPK